MEKRGEGSSSKGMVEKITAEEDEYVVEDSFNRTLVGKLWTESPYNIRAFKQTMIHAWRLKKSVEVQDLNKNLFLFKFSSQRDLEITLKSGPWSFDRNLLILEKVDGTEQPCEMGLHKVSFWTWTRFILLTVMSLLLSNEIHFSVKKKTQSG